IELAHSGAKAGIHVMWIAPDVTRLPAVCRTFLDVAPNQPGPAVGFVHHGTTAQPVELDLVAGPIATDLARRLAPVVDVSAGGDQEGDLPASVSFLTLTSEALATSPDAVIERWTETRSLLSGPRAVPLEGRRPGSLRAVLGQSAAGTHV